MVDRETIVYAITEEVKKVFKKLRRRLEDVTVQYMFGNIYGISIITSENTILFRIDAKREEPTAIYKSIQRALFSM